MGRIYRIQVDITHSWAEYVWDWKVLDHRDEIVWHGTAMYRWTAKRAAIRAAKKHAKGKRMNDGKNENLDYHIFVP
jgi:hypothetical protein